LTRAVVFDVGDWGYLHAPPAKALRIESLTELPEALGV
jgi:hypothetical protein